MFTITFANLPHLDAVVIPEKGTTCFYKFPNGQHWIILKLTYRIGLRRTLIDMLSTNLDVSDFSQEMLKKSYSKFTKGNIYCSHNSPCVGVFKDALTQEEQQITVNWIL